MAPGRLATISAAILCGGADATTAPGASRSAELLGELFEEVLIVGGDAALLPARRVPDLAGPACALRGLASALAAASGERVLVVSGDLPHVSADLVLGLVAWPEADVVLPRTRDGLQPLCALYDRERVLPAARARLASGDLALHDLLAALETSPLDESELTRLDPTGLALARD